MCVRHVHVWPMPNLACRCRICAPRHVGLTRAFACRGAARGHIQCSQLEHAGCQIRRTQQANGVDEVIDARGAALHAARPDDSCLGDPPRGAAVAREGQAAARVALPARHAHALLRRIRLAACSSTRRHCLSMGHVARICSWCLVVSSLGNAHSWLGWCLVVSSLGNAHRW